MNILNTKDEIVMSLVHYFVTEENYSPINVQGAKNEIWLENLDAPYKIIRINSEYIHNDEQLNMDMFKMNYIIKQIKKKTLSFKMNVLDICLDLGSSVKADNTPKNIEVIKVKSIDDIKGNDNLKLAFPKIETNNFITPTSIDKIIHVTDDINKKTEKENIKYEDIFKPKKIVVTWIIIGICILMYIISLLLTDNFNLSLLLLGANNRELVLKGDIYRLITCAFLHGSLIHLLVNMYSLYIIGNQVESYIGKWRYLVIYLLSAIMGSLLSITIKGGTISIGASGAIFGLMGSLLYFGYHYRLYLSNTLTTQIVPVILVNLFLGFSMNGIDNAAHIGGLIGGYLATMIVGIKYKSTKSETINGLIVYTLLTVFLVYILLKVV
jgi:rhomboid protease GluP